MQDGSCSIHLSCEWSKNSDTEVWEINVSLTEVTKQDDLNFSLVYLLAITSGGRALEVTTIPAYELVPTRIASFWYPFLLLSKSVQLLSFVAIPIILGQITEGPANLAARPKLPVREYGRIAQRNPAD